MNEPANLNIFADLIGTRVEIETHSDQYRWSDVGVLQAIEHPWVRLIKDSGDVMCFNAYHIRFIKALR
jgi:hypothetical protein